MTSPIPRYDDSIGFLRRWRPDGPWLLTAIGLDKTGIETRAFRADQEGELRKWLEAQGAARNIYFSVNPTFPAYIDRAAADGRSKKTEATDIESMVCLHVDLDPREGEDVAAEQRRIRERLTTNLPAGVPPPTLVVFSGGGCQGFWALREPVRLDGSKAAAEDANRWNLQLEVVFGADHCHNIDRIMRLPGTVNWPDSKKKAKGRTAALAEVVEWHPERAYDIGQFTKAPEVQAAGPADSGIARSAQRAKVSGNVKRYNGDIDAVPGADKLTPKARVVIVQGIDPDEPHKFGGSRSEWLLFACCAMVRAGFDDDTMYAVITDPAFGISASVLDKGSATEKYAIRQIERGKEEAVDPWLRRLNEQFAVVADFGGRCRVVWDEDDEVMGRKRLRHQAFEDFRNRFMHVQVQVGATDKGVPITKPLGQWWLQHEHRRQYERVVFAPGRELGPHVYNMWQGFACDARPGDCSLFLAHVRENLCRGDERAYEYLMNWMARCVQRPAEPGEVAVVLRGKEGTGKGFVAKTFGGLFGRHYVQVTDPKHLVGSFNAHLQDIVVVFADEAFYAGDKKHASILKTIITESEKLVERKGVDAEPARNYVHLIMASNEDWVVPVGLEDRRFFVLDVGEGRMQDSAYFEAISQQMRSGGREALLHLLLTRDVSSFRVLGDRPLTDALAAQKQQTLRGPESVLLDYLVRGVAPGTDLDKSDDPARFRLEDFQVAAKFDTPTRALWWLESRGVLDQQHPRLTYRATVYAVPGEPKVGRFRYLTDVPEPFRSRAAKRKGRTMYRFRPLGEIRAMDPWRGLVTDWPHPEEWTLRRDLPSVGEDDIKPGQDVPF
ncbi:MAG: hypothetical protein DYG93_08480 [Leptolyngbya sp. PLA2]|nr:hypothetical protein [Leptolyngbya sp.]MCE7971680.1 hypothetical protein [Leptolyngbya sp. PL-A2]MCQ3940002.1 hypothetical protein [cyanobacterium CYA1]MDL1903255.1 hypothetical protein [Synechococcales cyanobacterium CNB]